MDSGHHHSWRYSFSLIFFSARNGGRLLTPSEQLFDCDPSVRKTEAKNCLEQVISFLEISQVALRAPERTQAHQQFSTLPRHSADRPVGLQPDGHFETE